MATTKNKQNVRRTAPAAKDDRAPVSLVGAGRAERRPAMVKRHGDKLSEAFK